MRRRVTVGLTLLRAIAVAALVLLLWNPAIARRDPDGAPPLVLLDASLSMGGHGGRWRAALDTARALARGGVIWRFGSRVRAYDSTPPDDGATRLGPALAAAAGRGGPVSIVTDGAITDLATVPADLLRRARVVLLARPPFFDAFVAAVAGPGRVSAGDTLRLTVSYGTAGAAVPRAGRREATLALTLARRQVAARRVLLPDSGLVSTELLVPAARLPSPGWSALTVRLEGAAFDSEPRDDARLLVVEVSPQPSVVLLAAPPDWDSRFLARTLGDVARVPVRAYIQATPGANDWRDATTLAPVPTTDVARAVAGARLVVRVGDPTLLDRFTSKGATLTWPTTKSPPGEWYVQPPGPSPLAAALAGIAWDSLAPASALADLAVDSTATVVLTARRARRGAPHPVLVLGERAGTRQATLAASGLFRWTFRGGASAEAYRALVAAVADWLLAEGAGSGERAVPVAREVPNGTPLAWRWVAGGPSRDIPLTLVAEGPERVDTLRFDATGEAELWLPPGVYRYALQGSGAHALVAVDTYSDEWRPAAVTLQAQDGAPEGRVASTALRERWWLFALAVAAFATEWAWRRRQGLP